MTTVEATEASMYGAILLGKPCQISWEDMKGFVLDELRRQGIDPDAPDFAYVDSIMPCGENVVYKTFDDVPKVDTPCPCRDPRHWLVKVEEND